MQYQDLGKTHHTTLPLLGVKVKIVHLISAVLVAPFLALLVRALWASGPSLLTLFLLSETILFGLGRLAEVPATRELFRSPLRGCVSFLW